MILSFFDLKRRARCRHYMPPHQSRFHALRTVHMQQDHVNICIYRRTATDRHTHTHTCTHTQTRTRTHEHARACTHAHARALALAHTRAHTHTYPHPPTPAHPRTHARTHAHTHTHTHTHARARTCREGTHRSVLVHMYRFMQASSPCYIFVCSCENCVYATQVRSCM